MVESEAEEVQSACHQLQGEKCGLGLDWKHSCCVWRKGESEGSVRFHHERLIIKEQETCLNKQRFEIEACELCYER